MTTFIEPLALSSIPNHEKHHRISQKFENNAMLLETKTAIEFFIKDGELIITIVKTPTIIGHPNSKKNFEKLLKFKSQNELSVLETKQPIDKTRPSEVICPIRIHGFILHYNLISFIE